MSKQVAIATLIAGINAAAEEVIECTHNGAPFVAAAEDYLADLKADRAKLDDVAYKKTLTDAAADALTVYTTAETNWKKQDDLIGPFKTALSTAETNWTAQNTISTNATNEINRLAPLITAATTARGLSQGAVTTQNTLITNQIADNAKYVELVTEHETEKTTLTTAKTTADTELTAAETAITTATSEATALLEERNNVLAQGITGTNDYKYGYGQTKLAADTLATYNTKDGNVTTATNNLSGGNSTYKGHLKTLDTTTAMATMVYDASISASAVSSACKFTRSAVTYDCTGYTGDKIKAIYTGFNDSVKAYVAAAAPNPAVAGGSAWQAVNGVQASLVASPGSKTAWTALVDALATAQDEKEVALAQKTTADNNLTAIDNLIQAKQATYFDVCANCSGCTCTSVTGSGTATGVAPNQVYTGAVAAKGALLATKETKATAANDAKTALEVVYKEVTDVNGVVTKSGQLIQAQLDRDTGVRLLGLLQADLLPLTNDLAVKEYLLKVEQDKDDAEDVKKAAALQEVTALLTLKTMAKATVDRAQTAWDFYDAIKTAASTAKGLADTAVTTNTNKIAGLDLAITAAEADVAAAIATCKGLGYDAAQAALKSVMDADKAQQAAYDKIKQGYADKSAHPTDGTANTICAFPKKESKDADQLPRPVCQEGLCCGAAQKFLKDGTKLAIETCQKAEGTHTYEYYPPLLDTMSVEPTPETWRFQCISGAQKLIATASAALAASYMMA